MFIRAHKAPKIAGLPGYKPLPNQPRHLAPGAFCIWCAKQPAWRKKMQRNLFAHYHLYQQDRYNCRNKLHAMAVGRKTTKRLRGGGGKWGRWGGGGGLELARVGPSSVGSYGSWDAFGVLEPKFPSLSWQNAAAWFVCLFYIFRGLHFITISRQGALSESFLLFISITCVVSSSCSCAAAMVTR